MNTFLYKKVSLFNKKIVMNSKQQQDKGLENHTRLSFICHD